MRYGIAMVMMIVIVAGCKPRPWTMAHAPEDATPQYKQGWEDGCGSGMAAYGNDVYKAAYEFKQDPKMVNHPLYFRAWIDGYQYCRPFINRYLNDGFWGGVGFDQTVNLRNRDVTLGPGLNFFSNEREDGEFGRPIYGFNANYWGDEGGDWLGRTSDNQTDWLGRPSGYQ